MKVTQRTALSLAATVLLLTPPAHAHHSWSANYDLSQSKEIIGTVSRVKFQSPHTAIVISVETADGRRERWTVEWGSPHRLRERGVTETTIRPGDLVFVSGNPHRNPSTRSLHLQSLRRVSDGLELA